MFNEIKKLGKKIGEGVKNFWKDESGMGTVEVISESFFT